jgi:hypothetical protein
MPRNYETCNTGWTYLLGVPYPGHCTQRELPIPFRSDAVAARFWQRRPGLHTAGSTSKKKSQWEEDARDDSFHAFWKVGTRFKTLIKYCKDVVFFCLKQKKAWRSLIIVDDGGWAKDQPVQTHTSYLYTPELNIITWNSLKLGPGPGNGRKFHMVIVDCGQEVFHDVFPFWLFTVARVDTAGLTAREFSGPSARVD